MIPRDHFSLNSARSRCFPVMAAVGTQQLARATYRLLRRVPERRVIEFSLMRFTLIRSAVSSPYP